MRPPAWPQGLCRAPVLPVALEKKVQSMFHAERTTPRQVTGSPYNRVTLQLGVERPGLMLITGEITRIHE